MRLLLALLVLTYVALVCADDRLHMGLEVHTPNLGIGINRHVEHIHIDMYGYVRPAMTCGTGCRPPMHEYHVAGLHYQRGCSDEAVFNPERMGIVCEEEDSEECAPSYRYVAAFTVGCERKEANGTVTETYRTYSYKALAKAMDHFM